VIILLLMYKPEIVHLILKGKTGFSSLIVNFLGGWGGGSFRRITLRYTTRNGMCSGSHAFMLCMFFMFQFKFPLLHPKIDITCQSLQKRD
jgi:hypothetical protein